MLSSYKNGMICLDIIFDSKISLKMKMNFYKLNVNYLLTLKQTNHVYNNAIILKISNYKNIFSLSFKSLHFICSMCLFSFPFYPFYISLQLIVLFILFFIFNQKSFFKLFFHPLNPLLILV